MAAGATATPGAGDASDSPQPRTGGRVVVLASGAGSTLGGLLEASADPAWGARVVAVVSDRQDAGALRRARDAGLPAVCERLAGHPDRAAWDAALAARVAEHEPDLVVLAGFMRLVGPAFLARFGGRTVNTHPALSPAFPGTTAPADALAYGVKVTGATVHLVDEGMDTGAVLAQATVPVHDDDTPQNLHERIQAVERPMLVDVVGRMARHGWTVPPDAPRKVTIP